MTFATCRGCASKFAKDGWGAQSSASPRVCRDCERRERSYHPKHSPQVDCIARFLAE